MALQNLRLGEAEFDDYADPEAYDAALDRGISISGEDKSYFARGRVAWLANCLKAHSLRPLQVLDFGCGTGTATSFLLDILDPVRVIGVDTSARSIKTARRLHGSDRAHFLTVGEYEPCGEMDLVFCNGVFHHIPLAERRGAVDYIAQALRPHGLFACWENNPWNPGTRLVMKRIPFDRNAIPLSPPQARRMMASSGLEILGTDFLFVFPKPLSIFRGLEPWLSKIPAGAQYQVLCRKPDRLPNGNSSNQMADG
jgi:SAM-dependent methyltransferase